MKLGEDLLVIAQLDESAILFRRAASFGVFDVFSVRGVLCREELAACCC